MIEVKCNYTVEEFAKANWEMKKGIRIIMLIILVVMIPITILGFIMSLRDDRFLWSMLAIFPLAVIFFIVFLMLELRPKKFAKKLIKANQAIKDGVSYTFIFNEDEMTIVERLSTATSQSTIKYSVLVKVTISESYFFLYINKLMAYPLLKDNINPNDYDNLKNMLMNK